MATERQIAANRKNAQHCTGPRTPQGKEKSSMNALKTGLDAKSEIIRYEKREDYDALTAEYYKRFHPVTPEERALVDDLVKSEWHGRRYHAIDASVLDRAIQNVPSGSLGAAYTNCADTLSRVERRINSAQRNFQRALKQLMEIQAEREQEPQDEPESEPLQPTPSEPLHPESVSFHQNTNPAAPSAPAAPESTPEKEQNPPIAA